MSEPPGVPSALGIEAVEWIAEGGENLTVRVTGRWRRRRPAWSGQPMLVIEAPGRRYRFPALPEPPSLSGAGPGMWRISFTVPAALAADLGGRVWLQFGSVSVPLPAAVEFPTGEDEPLEPDSEPESEANTDNPRPSSELELEDARRRADEAGAALSELTKLVHHLERQLIAARERADGLSRDLSAQQASRRAAEQREHAERALRLDLARQLAARTREAGRAREALGELAEAEERVRRLEQDLAEAHRRIDEAEQAAAAAVAARQRAERRSEPARPLTAIPAETARLQFEAALIGRRAARAERIAGEPGVVPVRPRPPIAESAAAPPPPAPPPGAALLAAGTSRSPLAPAAAAEEVAPVASTSHEAPVTDAMTSALRRELELRATAEAGLRARVIEAETRLAARDQLARRSEQALGELRGELDGLRTAVSRERAAREAAEHAREQLERELGGQRARSREAYAAIGELRGTLESLRETREEQAASPVEPERLNQALARLREQIAPPEGETGPAEAPGSPVPPAAVSAPPAAVPAPPPAVPAPPRPGRPWLRESFRRLARSEPDRAGRLLVALLPAQAAVYPVPVAYDLVLGPELTIRINSGAGTVSVRRADSPRTPDEVGFQVVGDHAALARMVVAGRLRRRLSRRVARVRGDRRGVAALEALVGLRLDFAALHRLGVMLDPRTAMMLTAALIDPARTRGERLVLAYAAEGDDELYLTVGDGRVGIAAVRPRGPVAITVAGPAGTLEAVLAGERPVSATVTGDERSLALLWAWLELAQSG